MKVCILDYAGHAFTVELSRRLAQYGYEVKHLYFGQAETPRGRLYSSSTDPTLLSIEAVSLKKAFTKHNYFRRWWQEQQLARFFAGKVVEYDAHITIVANAPIDIVRRVQLGVKRKKQSFIFWQQDIYSLALEVILGKKYGAVGKAISRYYSYLEGRALRRSDHAIVISQDFQQIDQKRFGIAADHITVIPNWASPETIVPQPQINAWSVCENLDDKKVIMYTGTLGHKHNPGLLLKLAERMSHRKDVRIVIVSEGPGREWLQRQASSRDLRNISFHPFQSPESLPTVLGSARLLVAILEEEAGAYSVPSKVLSYLCAGRPIVLSAPLDNLAARTVQQAHAGFVHAPNDLDGFTGSVERLLEDDALAARLGGNARLYAEAEFSMDRVADRFMQVFDALKTAQLKS